MSNLIKLAFFFLKVIEYIYNIIIFFLIFNLLCTYTGTHLKVYRYFFLFYCKFKKKNWTLCLCN